MEEFNKLELTLDLSFSITNNFLRFENKKLVIDIQRINNIYYLTDARNDFRKRKEIAFLLEANMNEEIKLYINPTKYLFNCSAEVLLDESKFFIYLILADMKNIRNILTTKPKYFTDINFNERVTKRTPIYIAAKYNLIELALFLISKKAYLSFKQTDDSTPLHVACYRMNKNMVLMLLAAGCKTMEQNRHRKTPLEEVQKKLDIVTLLEIKNYFNLENSNKFLNLNSLCLAFDNKLKWYNLHFIYTPTFYHFQDEMIGINYPNPKRVGPNYNDFDNTIKIFWQFSDVNESLLSDTSYLSQIFEFIEKNDNTLFKFENSVYYSYADEAYEAINGNTVKIHTYDFKLLLYSFEENKKNKGIDGFILIKKSFFDENNNIVALDKILESYSFINLTTHQMKELIKENNDNYSKRKNSCIVNKIKNEPASNLIKQYSLMKDNEQESSNNFTYIENLENVENNENSIENNLNANIENGDKNDSLKNRIKNHHNLIDFKNQENIGNHKGRPIINTNNFQDNQENNQIKRKRINNYTVSNIENQENNQINRMRINNYTVSKLENQENNQNNRIRITNNTVSNIENQENNQNRRIRDNSKTESNSENQENNQNRRIRDNLITESNSENQENNQSCRIREDPKTESNSENQENNQNRRIRENQKQESNTENQENNQNRKIRENPNIESNQVNPTLESINSILLKDENQIITENNYKLSQFDNKENPEHLATTRINNTISNIENQHNENNLISQSYKSNNIISNIENKENTSIQRNIKTHNTKSKSEKSENQLNNSNYNFTNNYNNPHENKDLSQENIMNLDNKEVGKNETITNLNANCLNKDVKENQNNKICNDKYTNFESFQKNYSQTIKNDKDNDDINKKISENSDMTFPNLTHNEDSLLYKRQIGNNQNVNLENHYPTNIVNYLNKNSLKEKFEENNNFNKKEKEDFNCNTIENNFKPIKENYINETSNTNLIENYPDLKIEKIDTYSNNNSNQNFINFNNYINKNDNIESSKVINCSVFNSVYIDSKKEDHDDASNFNINKNKSKHNITSNNIVANLVDMESEKRITIQNKNLGILIYLCRSEFKNIYSEEDFKKTISDKYYNDLDIEYISLDYFNKDGIKLYNNIFQEFNFEQLCELMIFYQIKQYPLQIKLKNSKKIIKRYYHENDRCIDIWDGLNKYIKKNFGNNKNIKNINLNLNTETSEKKFYIARDHKELSFYFEDLPKNRFIPRIEIELYESI